MDNNGSKNNNAGEIIMVRFPEAQKRLYENVFVCRKCKKKVRADPAKIRKGKISCRGCFSKALRPVRKK